MTHSGFQSKHRQPSQHAKQLVRDAFDADKLKFVCETGDFLDYATRVELMDSPTGRPRFFYYKDNGSDILAIAHLDTVQDDRTCNVVDSSAGLLALSGGLDDRLGAYVILEMLPKLGIVCDWLLTTDEEIGQSTAEEFWPEHKAYNWMFQFDRGGTDVVMYEYETPELAEAVEACGARIGEGSFSDICLLDHLGCAGFNWGVGYEDYHSARSHAWLEDTFRMVARFVKFYKKNRDEWFPYERDDRYDRYVSKFDEYRDDAYMDALADDHARIEDAEIVESYGGVEADMTYNEWIDQVASRIDDSQMSLDL